MLFRNSDPSPFAALYAKDIKKNEFVRFATTVRIIPYIRHTHLLKFIR